MAQTFTVGEVEDAARLILLDTSDDSFRFEPKEIYEATASAVRRVRRVKPVSRYVEATLTDYDLSVPATFNNETARQSFRNTTIQMERQWKEAVVYYVVHRMYLKDDPDTTNANLAAKYLELHVEALA